MATVLVVEDNPANMSLAVFLLQSASYTVLSAADAEAGLALAREHQPQLILMDIHLPGMDGLEATALLTDLGDPSDSGDCPYRPGNDRRRGAYPCGRL